MPINLTQRSEEEELMDDLDSSGEVIEQTLQELEVINRLLGGNRLSWKGLERLIKIYPQEKYTLLDIGCGGGDLLILMARWAKRKGYNIEFIGIDANPHIVEYARANCIHYPEISFQCLNIFDQTFANLTCDFLHASLFTHHFTDTQLIDLFQVFKKQTQLGIVVNDLHRHALAYYSIQALTRFLSKSPMVRHDAALSVARSFRRADWQQILNAVQLTDYELKWKWAFRWKLIIYNRTRKA
ncbi:MAG: methyltransferase domain-containing protein [Bacteroidota bacterium]